MTRLIVTDTGPLIIYARTGYLYVLRGVADCVVLTQTVQHECTRNAWQPGAVVILEALAQGHLTVVPDVAHDATGKASLDPGERSAINYALTQDPKHCRLLMDEVRGRAVAKHLGLAVIGSAGLLVVAKKMQGSATLSTVGAVVAEQRVSEIARMLGGEKLSKTTLAHAREMLQTGV